MRETILIITLSFMLVCFLIWVYQQARNYFRKKDEMLDMKDELEQKKKEEENK